jgi:3-methyladenine DNA glycosylase/8-oxoguanine DNA glycosylase
MFRILTEKEAFSRLRVPLAHASERRRSQVVRQRSAKPSFAGSIPAVASISLPPGFNFESTVVSHGWYLLAPYRWSRANRTLHRREILGGKPCELTIRAGLPGKRRAAVLHIEGAGDSKELRRKLARMFQLQVDTSEFIAIARGSESHAWVESAGFGRLLCGSTLFEDVVKIIATTNTTWRQTVRMVELIVEKCGRGGAFPEPEDVLRFSADELQRDCRLGYRAKSIHALANGMAEGSIDLDAISDVAQSTEELFASYRTLPGIGPYGAAHLLAMDGRHDFIAVDSEFRRFVRETHHNGRRVSDKTMLRRYKKWGRWKYLAYWAELWGGYRNSGILP